MTSRRERSMAQALHEAGYRLTQPRRAVLQVLEESAEQLSPYEIHRRGKGTYPQLGLVTVYRTLELLDGLGLVRRVHSEGSCHNYARAGEDKHYLVCRGCHRVVQFPCGGLDELIEEVERRSAYEIDGHLLELTGLCPECQDRE
ncbi:MAG: Fur family transcriptional regulator [Anaerolineae bacterium]|jgi:Fur family ferric uptake transcriptional regulator